MSARTPEQMHAVFEKALNSGDLEAVAALYEPGAGIDAEAGKFVVGQKAVREVLAGFLALKGKITVKTTRCVQAGDLAVLHADWSLKYKGPDGKALGLSGKTTEVVRRQPDGAWRYVIDLPDE